MCLAAALSQAQSIHAYKSVHTDGTVSYSDTRPAVSTSVEKLTIIQDSAAIEQQGKQRVQQMDAAAKTLEEQRAGQAEATREYQKQLNVARQELSEAERHLVSVQQSKKNATSERVAAAQQRVQLARRKLREVQSAAP
jgi:primase-polymerase (primpol)-like protein